MTDSPTAPRTDDNASSFLAVEDNLGSVLDVQTVYQLRKFQHDNTPSYLRMSHGKAPQVDDAPADDREIYDLLVFAARRIGSDLTVARSLEALRVVRLVPEDIGAAIFAKIEGP